MTDVLSRRDVDFLLYEWLDVVANEPTLRPDGTVEMIDEVKQALDIFRSELMGTPWGRSSAAAA